MILPSLRLTDATRIFPWLGAGLLFYSIFVLINHQNEQDLIRPPERHLLSGWFDTVVIDPGHGGSDDGASAHGLKEKDITLDLGQKFAEALHQEGFRTLLTRDADIYLGLSDRVSFANLVPHAIFVSLHCNFSSDSNAKGLEVYRCSEKSGNGMAFVSVADSEVPEQPLERIEAELAQKLSGSAVQLLHVDNRGEKTANFFVVRNVFYPAVLVECGFLTNGEEARRLTTGSYRQQLAQSLAIGIANYRTAIGRDRLKAVQLPAVTSPAAVSSR